MLIPCICSAQSALFQGRINANDINVRSDSTVASKLICTVDKGELVEVVKESYGWYKIRLPGTAPSFIKKDLVTLIDEKTAKVIKDNVNIRLMPNESSAILGRAVKNEIINILGGRGGWYKIEPLHNSFGWVYKQFVSKADTVNKQEEVKPAKETKEKNKIEIVKEEAFSNGSVTVEGIINPYGKVINRIATHKLISLDNKVFLLKGTKGTLDSLNYRKVRVTGKLIYPKDQKSIVIEIQKIEALD